MPKLFIFPVFACVFFFLASCRSMGPKTIPPDGFNYNAQIALQDNEQLLLNIVRLRYAEVPQFLVVSSVINQYSRTGGAGVSGEYQIPGGRVGGNLNGSWTDRPTITYAPMTGQSFSQSLLTPLPPSVLFFLIQSGWSANRLLRLTTSVANRMNNENGNPRARRQSDPGFLELMEVLTDLQHDELLGMHFDGAWPDVDVTVYFPEEVSEESSRQNIQRFKELLNLDPNLNEFSVRYGLIQDDETEIVVQTHSMLEMLSAISWYIEVPNEHVEEGRTANTFVSEAPPLISIRSSPDKPQDAFVAIPYKGYWFYVDDRNVDSKTSFSILRILLSLAEDGGGAVAPLISIGN